MPRHDSTCLCGLLCVQAEAQQAESVDVINAWADRVTKGLIKVAVPPGTPFDVVLTNAVYFKVVLSLSQPKTSIAAEARLLMPASLSTHDA